MFLRDHRHRKDDMSAHKSRRVKKGTELPSTSVPPLFDPDPRINREAWARRFFPENIPPDQAIRIWLGNRTNGHREVSTDNDRSTIVEPVPSSTSTTPNGNGSDDRLTSTLQDIAQMVTAALCGEQEQRRSNNGAVRHPIHWCDFDVPQPSVTDAPNIQVPVAVPSVEGMNRPHETPQASGRTDSRLNPTPARDQSTSDRNSADGEHHNYVRWPGDIWQNNQPNVPDVGTETSDTALFPTLSDMQSMQSHTSKTPAMAPTEPDISQLPPDSTKHSKAQSSVRERSTLKTAVTATVFGIVLFAAVTTGDAFYQRTRTARLITSSQSAFVVGPARDSWSQLQPSSNPAPDSSAIGGSEGRNSRSTDHLGTAHHTNVQHLYVIRSRNGVAVEVITKGRVVPKVSKLTDPDRVVLDLADTNIATETHRILVNTAGVKSVRMGLTSVNPPTTRIVVDLFAPHEYTFLTSDNKLTLQLRSSAR
jgi:hypothetical protein